METSLKVLIADHHPLALQGIRRMLQGSDGIDVVGDTRSGRELLALVGGAQPDLVLLHLPTSAGLEWVAAIKRSWPHVKTVTISAREDRETIDAAFLAGASAYVVKTVSPLDIPSILRHVVCGTVHHARPPWNDGHTGSGGPALTPRETVILKAVAGGLTTKAISRELWLSEHTVKFHLTNIYRKLGVTNRSGAVRYACENQLTALRPLEASA